MHNLLIKMPINVTFSIVKKKGKVVALEEEIKGMCLQF